MATEFSSGPAIGIDLGTTYSCVAVCENGVVTIIKNNLGQNTTPSYVAFPDPSLTNSTSIATPIIGDSAKKQGNINPENVVYDVKRLIGRKFNDPVVQKDIKLWPFKVTSEDNSPRILVNGSSYHPEQISAKILAHLKKQAEAHLGVPVTDAVITVPAYFNDGQRQATKDAGSIAGLNVLRIINEPTAAAIAYNHQLQQQTNPTGTNPLRKKNVLIFDLGGGTFDLALLTMEGSIIEVKAVDGDTHLGGQDFDNELVNYCLREFEKKHSIDLSQCQPNARNPAKEKVDLGKRLRRLKNECEAKKVNLSAAKFITLCVEVIYETYDLSVKIKRETFESINEPLFEKCIEIVKRILTEAKMTKEEIDDVVLVGGSSRIPKIQDMLRKFFGGRAPMQTIKQDEAVAYGAAVVASSLSSQTPFIDTTKPNIHRTPQSSTKSQANENKPKSEVQFVDVIPLNLGIKVFVEKGDTEDFAVVLNKNTAVPHTTKKRFRTVFPNQSTVKVAVYEGTSSKVIDNHLLGEFSLSLPPNCPEGEPVDVQMEVDKEGILQVSGEVPSNQNKYSITVTALKGRLKKEDLDRMRKQQIEESTMLAAL